MEDDISIRVYSRIQQKHIGAVYILRADDTIIIL